MARVNETDVATSYAKLGKALNDPAEGVDSLTKLGVKFTDQQIEQVEALQKSGDILSAQKLILEGVAASYKGAAEAMRDPLQGAKEDVGNFREEIGTLLLEAGGAAALDLFADGVRNVSDAVKNTKAACVWRRRQVGAAQGYRVPFQRWANQRRSSDRWPIPAASEFRRAGCEPAHRGAVGR